MCSKSYENNNSKLKTWNKALLQNQILSQLFKLTSLLGTQKILGACFCCNVQLNIDKERTVYDVS